MTPWAASYPSNVERLRPRTPVGDGNETDVGLEINVANAAVIVDVSAPLNAH